MIVKNLLSDSRTSVNQGENKLFNTICKKILVLKLYSRTTVLRSQFLTLFPTAQFPSYVENKHLSMLPEVQQSMK